MASERELPDDYPIYAGFLYVADDVVVRADKTTTAMHFKAEHGFINLTNCDIAARNLWEEMI